VALAIGIGIEIEIGTGIEIAIGTGIGKGIEIEIGIEIGTEREIEPIVAIPIAAVIAGGTESVNHDTGTPLRKSIGMFQVEAAGLATAKTDMSLTTATAARTEIAPETATATAIEAVTGTANEIAPLETKTESGIDLIESAKVRRRLSVAGVRDPLSITAAFIKDYVADLPF
jgi:hypothetical protein